MGFCAAARHTFALLCRDEDCEGVLRSMARMEQRFNHKFRYPYVFLNNGPFSSEFKSRSVQHIHVQKPLILHALGHAYSLAAGNEYNALPHRGM